MTITQIAACPLCGLRFSNRPLLELHLREDHPRRPRDEQAEPEQGPGDSAARPG